MDAFDQISLVRRSFYHDRSSPSAINPGEPARPHMILKSTKGVAALDPKIFAEDRATALAVEEKLRAKGYLAVGPIAVFSAPRRTGAFRITRPTLF
jgi:hypothetical protein